MTKVSIIVLNWNGERWMEKCLGSVKENTTYYDYEVIVVDNGSKDGSVELLEKLKKQGLINVLIKNSENKGFAYANNQGFAKAKGQYYFMLNNDTLVTKNWLTNAVNVLESDSKIAAVGSKLIQHEDYDSKKYGIGPDVEKQTTCGAAMLMRKDVIDKIGVLDAENFSPIYGEETDWCYRARSAGFKIMETNSSRIVHLGSVDTKRQTGKEWQYTLMNTNRVKAMLYNLGAVEFAKHIPGLGLIFARSIKDGMLKYLLQSYWNNVKILGHTLKERKKRKLVAKKIKKENSQKRSI